MFRAPADRSCTLCAVADEQQGEMIRAGVRPSHLALVAIVGVLALASDANADSVTPAAAVTQHVSVRSKASSTAPVVGKLKKDEVAELVGTTKYWRKVQLASGLKGYVSKRWTVVVEPTATADRNLVVTFIDIDEGDAILIQLDDVDLLVDTGKANAWDLSLGAALGAVDGPLEAVFITHPHLDHYGGAADVLANLDVTKVYTNGERRGPPRVGDSGSQPTWKEFEKAVSDEGLAISTLKVGDVLKPATGLTLGVLATGSPTGGQFPDTKDGTDINNDSLILMLEYAGRRLLLTGDIEIDAGESLVNTYCPSQDPTTCPQLHADVLKVPHHGSASFAPGFFTAVSPEWAVTSAAFESSAHCLPRVEPNDALIALGAKLISTSADGNEHAVLTVAKTGAMSWAMPTKEIFAWRKKAGAASKCGVKAQYEQGK